MKNSAAFLSLIKNAPSAQSYSVAQQLATVYLNIKSGALLINRNEERRVVSFQRDFVWGKDKQKALISSFAMWLPVPSLCVTEIPHGDSLVTIAIDGQQRLATIEAFFSNQLKVSVATLLRLRDSDFQGMAEDEISLLKRDLSFADLEELFSPLASKIKRYMIPITTVEYVDANLRYEIFRRMNLGGVMLSSGEILAGVHNDSPIMQYIIDLEAPEDHTAAGSANGFFTKLVPLSARAKPSLPGQNADRKEGVVGLSQGFVTGALSFRAFSKNTVDTINGFFDIVEANKGKDVPVELPDGSNATVDISIIFTAFKTSLSIFERAFVGCPNGFFFGYWGHPNKKRLRKRDGQPLAENWQCFESRSTTRTSSQRAMIFSLIFGGIMKYVIQEAIRRGKTFCSDTETVFSQPEIDTVAERVREKYIEFAQENTPDKDGFTFFQYLKTPGKNKVRDRINVQTKWSQRISDCFLM